MLQRIILLPRLMSGVTFHHKQQFKFFHGSSKFRQSRFMTLIFLFTWWKVAMDLRYCLWGLGEGDVGSFSRQPITSMMTSSANITSNREFLFWNETLHVVFTGVFRQPLTSSLTSLRQTVVTNLCYYVFVFMSTNLVYAMPMPIPQILIKLFFGLYNS